MVDLGPGTYLLLLRLHRARAISVGKLGIYRFAQGYYGYVGSAFGPGGLPARLRHHAGNPQRLHWHIDYLRRHAGLLGALVSCAPDRFEHRWASQCAHTAGFEVVAPGFGSSDCGCPAHLFLLDAGAGDGPSELTDRFQSIADDIRWIDAVALKKS